MSTLKLLVLLGGFTSLFASSPSAHAATFNPSSIISDGIFTNKNSMQASDIKNFIDAKGAGCVNGEAPCLKNFTENGKSSAQIIYDAAQAFSINPQVLLATLQKETGLLTKSGPGAWRYRTAMGYGCPDSTPGVCDAEYYGFTNQVTWASRMFRAIMNASPTWRTPYVVGKNFIYWSPEASCGGSDVNIENRATQALYNYTPYQPNAAALAAGYGEGDSCSAYGNRNFFNYFNDWFGSSTIDGRVYVEQLDAVADIDGEPAKIGFRLNFRPDYPVTILVQLNNPSTAGIVSSVDRVTIQPDDWNNPSKNVVQVYGKDDGKGVSSNVYLQTTDVASRDPRFDLLNGVDVGDPAIVVQSAPRGVYRLYSPTLDRHIYTGRQAEVDLLQTQGYSNEGVKYYACEAGTQNIVRISNSGISLLVDGDSSEYVSAIQSGFRLDQAQFSASYAGSIPVYRLRNANNNYLYTIDIAERDAAMATHQYTLEGTAFFSCPANDKPIFRLVNAPTGQHFFTANPTERDYAGSVGYNSEGVGFYSSNPADGMPIYRMFSIRDNDHFYTTSLAERDFSIRSGYSDEGVGFTLPKDAKSMPVYRLFSSTKKEHFYTLYASERDAAVASRLYVDEGIAFYTK